MRKVYLIDITCLGNFEGLVYSLNFSSPFNTNDSQIAAQSGGAAHNIAPNYVDGAMFSDDYEFALYGCVRPIPASEKDIEQGYVSQTINQGTTRYITGGAAVSVPSERLGFYFSGMRAPDWGPIWSNGTANTTATTLITADMTKMGNLNFTNSTVSDLVLGRAGAELVWVPISPKGVLVAIGGVVNPEYYFRSGPLGGLSPSQSQESVSSYTHDHGFHDANNGTAKNKPWLHVHSVDIRY